jgi:hypothetical protein
LAKKREPTKYDGKSLPYLYKICNEKGIRKYVGKNEEECIALLVDYDDKMINETLESDKEPTVAKPTKNVKKAVEELDDDIIIDDAIEEDTPAEEESDDVVVEDDGKGNEDDDEITIEEDTSDEDITADADDITDDDLVVEDDDESEVKTSKKESKSVAKKAVEEVAVKASVKKSVLAVQKPSMTEKKPALSAKAKEKVTSGKGKKAIDLTDKSLTSPFVTGSAGHYVFEALKKANKNSIEKIAELADKMIAKAGVTAPKDTVAKMKIIIQVINSGQKGDRWGKIEKDDNGKITYVAK